MSRELLKEAHRVMSLGSNGSVRDLVDLFNKIETELAKPEPEPVAWLSRYKNDGSLEICTPNEGECDQWLAGFPVYTHPPRQQDQLSDDQIKKLCTDFYFWWHNQPGTNTMEGFDEWWKTKAHGIGGDK